MGHEVGKAEVQTGGETNPEVEGGTGAEDDGAGTGDDGARSEANQTPNVQPPSGASKIDAALDFEPIILAVSALREIAAAIAARVKKWTDQTPLLVVLGDKAFLAQIANWRALSMRIEVLEKAMEEVLHTEKEEAVPIPILAHASAGIEAVAYLLSFFKADTAYYGRPVALDSSALYPVVAGKLSPDLSVL
ncbi:hypothetical protein NKG95_31820 [Mesorhizobium sp. M1423]|uniref:hypothetical protein n=1 Tax=Mesorhizobium sp. M1423 TaxID=2957101 RepID=UPI00333A5B5F